MPIMILIINSLEANSTYIMKLSDFHSVDITQSNMADFNFNSALVYE